MLDYLRHAGVNSESLLITALFIIRWNMMEVCVLSMSGECVVCWWAGLVCRSHSALLLHQPGVGRHDHDVQLQQVHAQLLQVSSRWSRVSSRWSRVSARWSRVSSRWSRVSARWSRVSSRWSRVSSRWSRMSATGERLLMTLDCCRRSLPLQPNDYSICIVFC